MRLRSKLSVFGFDSIKVGSINTLINYYGNNTKCVIKHQLFLTPSFGYSILIDAKYFKQPAMSIPNYKLAKEKYSLISESIKGKTDKNEIITIIKNLLRVRNKNISSRTW